MLCVLSASVLASGRLLFFFLSLVLVNMFAAARKLLRLRVSFDVHRAMAGIIYTIVFVLGSFFFSFFHYREMKIAGSYFRGI